MVRKVWSTEEDEYIKKQYLEGLSVSQIGKATGRGKNAVAGRLHRLNIADRGSCLPTKEQQWTEEENAKLVRLQAEGLSYTQIAARIGKSWHAVGNRFRRIRAKAHKAALKKTAPPQGNPVCEPKPQPKPRIIYDKRVGELAKSLNGKCQWPLGDPRDADFHFCHAPAKGSPYCEEHTAMAYTYKPPKVSDRPTPRPELRSDLR